MRKFTLLAACAVLICLVSSCDFFRILAGRPTSRDIASKRARIELAQQREAEYRDSLERARADSVARERKAVADSLHAIDTLTTIGKYHKASAYHNIPMKRLTTRYALVVGVFSNEANASRLAGKYTQAGMVGSVLRYRSGLCAVLVSPCDKVAEVLEAYRTARSLPFSSQQTWVLVNE